VIPAPNVIAGVMIGIAADTWLIAVTSAIGWSFVFCLYVTLHDRPRRDVTIDAFRHRSGRLLLGSPVLTFYAIEFSTALVTALPVALMTHAIVLVV
jgi:hypothetical protein